MPSAQSSEVFLLKPRSSELSHQASLVVLTRESRVPRYVSIESASPLAASLERSIVKEVRGLVLGGRLEQKRITVTRPGHPAPVEIEPYLELYRAFALSSEATNKALAALGQALNETGPAIKKVQADSLRKAKSRPSPRNEERLAQRRQALIESGLFLDSTGVAAQAGSTSRNASDFARRQRVISVKHLGRNLYPRFQFDPTSGKPHRAIRALLDAVPEGYRGWALVLWLNSPSTLLDGRLPVEVFAEQPKRVVEAARSEFSP
ncbi:MAG: hypothetical protein M0Q42_01525 [Xanthomonadales bacterium]|nr:hypothetical protein [Xanthomonadales bacterium]